MLDTIGFHLQIALGGEKTCSVLRNGEGGKAVFVKLFTRSPRKSEIISRGQVLPQ